MAPLRNFVCEQCGKVPNAPMLKDEVWEKIADRRSLLCIACTEERLRRRITIDDLLACPANDFTVLVQMRANVSLMGAFDDTSGYEAGHRLWRLS